MYFAKTPDIGISLCLLNFSQILAVETGGAA